MRDHINTNADFLGASAPQPQDEQELEVDRAYENLQKSGKGFMPGGRRKFSPMHHGPGSARSTPDFGKQQHRSRYPRGGMTDGRFAG
jgi:hypothetical protein